MERIKSWLKYTYFSKSYKSATCSFQLSFTWSAYIYIFIFTLKWYWQHDLVWIIRHSQTGFYFYHYSDDIMGAMASKITCLTIVYSTVYSGADQRKHQSSASLAFVWGIHRWPVNFQHKWQVKQKMFPFDDVTMIKRNFSRWHRASFDNRD